MNRRYLAASAAALGAMGLLGVSQVRFANASRTAAVFADLDDEPRRVDGAVPSLLLAQDAPPASPTLPAPATSPAPAGEIPDLPPQPASPSPTEPDAPAPLQPMATPTPDVAPPVPPQPVATAPASAVPLPQPGNEPSGEDLLPSPSLSTPSRRSSSAPARRSPSRPPRQADAPFADDSPTLEPEGFDRADDGPRPSLFRRRPAPARREPAPAVGMPGERSPFDLDDRPSTDLDSVFPTPGDRVPNTPAEDGEARARHYVRELILARNATTSPDSDPEIRRKKAFVLNDLGQQFDARQRRYVDEIEALEARVARLRALVDKRQENRDDIVHMRLNQLLSESEGLGW